MFKFETRRKHGLTTTGIVGTGIDGRDRRGEVRMVLRRSVSPKSKVPGRWDQRWINDKRLGNGPKLQGDRWVLWFKGDAHQWGVVELLW